MYVTVALYTQKIVCDTDTVDGKQSFSPVMYEFRASQVVQDFVHQPYENTHKHQTCVIDSQAHETNTYTLWTVPWLMATRGEVLDTVKSIQVAFWSFANHLCGLQPSQICRKTTGHWCEHNVTSELKLPLEIKAAWGLCEICETKQSFGIRFLTYLIQESLAKACCLSSLWLCTHLSDLVCLWQCPRAPSNLTLYIIHG